MSGKGEGAALGDVEDVMPAQFPPLDWSAGHVSASLSALRAYVETEAIKASAWYLAKRGKKRILGRILRGLGILFTGAAGLLPILSQLWMRDDKPVVAPAWSTLLLGVAALCVLFDRFLGATSAWMRYLKASQEIGTLFQEFQFDWERQRVDQSGHEPTASQLSGMILRCHSLLRNVDRIVRQETEAWITDFRGVLTQMEESAAKAPDAGRKPRGTMDLEVTNGDLATGGWTVRIDDEKESEHHGRKIVLASLAPGFRRVSVLGQIGADVKKAEKIIRVPEGGAASASVTLS